MLNKKQMAILAATVLVGVFVSTGCNNAGAGSSTPAAPNNPATAVTEPTNTQPKTTAPVEPITVDQETLYQEFTEDAETAMAKYQGKRLVFKNVLIEDMPWLYKGVGTDWYVINSYVKYKTIYLDYLNDLRINYIVNIEGEVFGMQENILVIEDCEYIIVDDSNGIEMPDYVFTF